MYGCAYGCCELGHEIQIVRPMVGPKGFLFQRLGERDPFPVGDRCSRPEAIGDRDFWPAMFCTEGAVRLCAYLVDVGGGVAQPPMC
jgi:hypothetical protein